MSKLWDSRFFLHTLIFCLIFCGIGPFAVVAQGPGQFLTVRYFQQLRQRRLFSVAEQLGADRLADPLITPAESIQLVVELSKTYAEHARYTSGEEHEQYWRLAESLIEDALAKFGEHPRSLLLRVQRAFLPAKRAEFLRGQIELFPYDQTLQKQAEEVFQTALKRLKPLETELAKKHRQLTLSRQPQTEGLATYEIHDLHDETRYQLAVTLEEFAKMPERPLGERSKLLREAYAWLDILSEAGADDPFKFLAKIRLAENRRLRDDLNGADGVLKELEEDPLPKELEPALVAERVRWFLAKGNLTEALTELQTYRRISRQDTGELAFLNAQVLMAMWEAAESVKNANRAAQLAQQIESLLKSQASLRGGYWAYRMDQLRNQRIQAQKYGIQVAALVKRAEAKYAVGEAKTAAADYRQASELAQKIGKPEAAFDLGYIRASILFQTKVFTEAAAAFHQLCVDFPQNARTPNAHLLEAYCLGKLYQEDPTQAVREQNYSDLLKEHVEKYPRHETRGDAYWMLGQLAEQGKQVTQALSYYRNVPGTHRLGSKAQLAVAGCYEKVIAQLHELEATSAKAQQPAIKERTLEWEQAGADELGQLIAAYPKEPGSLSAAQADVVLQLARLQLMRTKPEYAKADSLLERILADGAKQQSAEWARILKTSRQLRIVSLAGQGLSKQAEVLVKQLGKSSTEDVLGVMDGLMQVARAADTGTRQKLGQLQLQTANELNSRRQELKPAEQERLDLCRAEAYLATNRLDDALKLYDQMLADQPKSKGLRLRVAGLLEETGEHNCLVKAKSLWRSLEAQEKPGTASWLERRYRVARCCWELGETDECRKLLGVTKLLYPKLGNAELRSKYGELEKEIAGKR